MCAALSAAIRFDMIDLDPRSDGEAVAEALPAASIILLRPAAQGFETLLMQRNPELRTMGGLWVFPGGKIDADDPGDCDEACARSAACRELEEEASVVVSASELLSFSHWLTPKEVRRRYATWFYAATVTADTRAREDGSEMVAHRWVRPAEAIREHHSETLRVPPPTLATLQDLAEHDALDALLAMVSARVPPYFFPKVVAKGDAMTFLYPGDAGYAAGEPDTSGPRHRTEALGGRFFYERSFAWPLRLGG